MLCSVSCGTALSSHEVSQGYKAVTERSAVVRFKVKGEENTYLYAWTTTPWTLPSNVALCVNPDETYAKFDCEGRTIIMGDALIEQVLGDKEIENGTVSVRERHEGDLGAWPVEQLVEKLREAAL